ncbi:MAG: FapA family protein [Clostridiaceae bacterium]|nr:FapA family protein [Clostridiaceae bacterium]
MKRNAFFQLIHRDHATYFKSYPAVDGGSPITVEDVKFYMEKKRFDDIDINLLKQFAEEAAKEQNAYLKIADKSFLPENEFPVITVDPMKYYAKIRLYPNSNMGARLSEQDILMLLEQQGIQYGILEKNIQMMLRARLYCTDILVAQAKMPLHGKSAEIIYHFNLDKTNKPAVSENGQVDFHKLDMIEPVEEGQLLATLIPADLGTPGTDVSGNTLKPKKVNQLKLKHGKNIHLSEDALEMYSDVSGNVTCVDGTVFVSDCYEVPADVGPSTGDIDYDGSVKVKGNVLTGYTVKAAGDIYVSGAVEGATLISEGKIVLNRGVQGMGKAVLEAKGDVISNFIESSNVSAGGKIITDAILHSDVVAKDEIEVNGKRGLIAGGSIRSAQRIETKTAGSSMGTVTELEVGIDPQTVDRYHEIEETMEELAEEKEVLVQNVEVLTKRYKAKGSLEPEKLQQLMQHKERMDSIEQQMDELTEEYDKLEVELEECSGNGRIVVRDIAYTGVKITISNISNYLHSEVHHSTFVRDGADIRIRGI